MASVTSVPILWGDSGTLDTLALMKRLITEGVDDPGVIAIARRLALFGGVRQELDQALMIRSFLAQSFRFVDDPLDRELLRDAPAMLAEIQQYGTATGDCDEAAVLGATLGKVIGLGAALTVLAFPEPGAAPSAVDPFCHVYATLLTSAGRAVDLDVTRPAGPIPVASRWHTIEV